MADSRRICTIVETRRPRSAICHQPSAMSTSASFTLIALAAPGALLALLLDLRHRLAAPRPALAFAHAFEDLDQAKIDLPYVHVDADDLHLDLVAEPVLLVRVLAHQQMPALDEAVIIVGHR